MKKMLTRMILPFTLVPLIATNAVCEPLFERGGKPVSKDDLAPSAQQMLHEVEMQYHESLKQVIDAAIFEEHVHGLAKSKNKSHTEIESDLLKAKEPTDKEIQAWYDKNKDRIPYPLDKVKPDIARLLTQEQQSHARDTIINAVKKDIKFKSLLKEPVAPVVAINTKGLPSKGPDSAKVEIVEFADYQCPHCKSASTSLKALLNGEFKDKVKLVYADFPINKSGISTAVSEGAFCANKQGKFWDYHYKAFSEQADLSNDWPKKAATALNLDTKSFEDCIKSDEAKKFVTESKEQGEKLGINGTPTIFINGRKVFGYTEEKLKEAIKAVM